MDEQYVLHAALFREVVEAANSTLGLVSGPSPAHLTRIRAIRDDIDRLEAGLVAILRAEGQTWEYLAVAAGVTRQSLYSRLKGRSARWVESIRRPVGGDNRVLRDVLGPAWERAINDLKETSTKLPDLGPEGFAKLGVLPPPPDVTVDRIDVFRRTSPSGIPR